MANFPNQKTIIITRTSDRATDNYFKVSNDNLYEAMKNLNYTTFMLWIYFCDNKKNWKLDLYPIDFTNKTGISYKTYTRCFQELEEKGYLIKIKEKKNYYLFKEKSDNNNIITQDYILSLEEKEVQDLIDKYI